VFTSDLDEARRRDSSCADTRRRPVSELVRCTRYALSPHVAALYYDGPMLLARDPAAVTGDGRSSTALLETIADAVPAVLVYLDVEERYVYANRYYRERYGRPDDLLGRTARDVVGEVMYARIAPHLQRALAGETTTFEAEIERSAGSPLWVTATYIPDVGPDGRVRGIIALSEDISHQREVEREHARLLAGEQRAREHLARLQELTAALSRARTVHDVADVVCRLGTEAIGAASGAIWTADADGALVLAGSWGVAPEFSQQFRRLPAGDERFPVMRVLRTGEPMWINTREDFAQAAPAIYENIERAGYLGAVAVLPLIFDGRPGGALTFRNKFPHTYDPDDQKFYTSVALYCAQALERARLLDEARAAKESAEHASRVKDEFLAMLGHELRNPLAPIVTAVQLMNARPSDAFVRERLVIERQVRHLGRLVDDLLDVSRIARGRVALDFALVLMSDVIERAVEMARPLLEERRHALHVEVPAGLSVQADPMRLAQVVANLLNNAARYTPPGGHVSIVARRESGEIVVRVRDDGVGVPRELLPRVFDLFAQGSQASDRPHGGLGLGLAIVKNLVLLHGGCVEARSDGENRGTEMIVRLRAVPSGTWHDARADLAHAASRGDVLLVDDNDDAAEMLALALTERGYSVRVAGDGSTALALVASSRPPDVAVLDIGLPQMDGYELARRMRIAAPRTHLVALTGYGQAADRARTRALGFVEHLVKPVEVAALDSVLGQLTRPSLV
jgi:PAS domain S-box-containing protein